MRILIVDDNYFARLANKGLLSAYGDCDAVPDGDIAARMFIKAHEEGHPYRLITVDVDMPGIDGPEVVAQIRKWEAEHQADPAQPGVEVWMITGTREQNDVVTSYGAGCGSYLVKPLTAGKIRNAFEESGLIALKPLAPPVSN